MKIKTYVDPYPVTVKCAFCERKIQRNKYYLRKHPTSFCSQPCRILYNDPKQAIIMKHEQTNTFAYLVGLISTDGYISYPDKAKTYKGMIKLNCKDEYILKQIQNIFGGIITYDNIKTCCWYV